MSRDDQPAPPAAQSESPDVAPTATQEGWRLRPPAPTDGAPDSPEATATVVRGDRSYRLLAELGQGGMGTVFLAERADGEFRQQVAIKLVRRGGEAARQLLRRFRLERQILAALDHPNIAKLLDGGSLPDGSPFLVLELVHGERIDHWCEAKGATARRRVELMVEVCAAVAAAHRRLIVHRDLKPANILVTDSGGPKLLDFGIAKLLDPRLDPELAEVEAADTRTGVAVLTLAYASPEQLRAEPVTTATDVYSLGVVLYELLAGRSPYGDGLTDLDLLRAIAEREPAPPSLAARDREAARANGLTHLPDPRTLAGDLDAIVLKALRKEPAARYPSVEALADDLRRYLDGRPVAARRGSRSYRLGKLLRRHRVAAALSALVVLSLGALAAGAVLASRRLARERDATASQRDAARRERDTARATTDFLVKLFAAADPSEARGEQVTARELLDRGAKRIDRELAGQPAVQATLLDTLGRVHANLGLYDPARAQLARALELRTANGLDAGIETTRTLAELGWTEVQAGEFEAGEARLAEALDRERLTPETTVLEAQLLSQLGAVAGYRERYDDARALLEEAAAVRRALPPGDDRVLANALNNLALVQATLERWSEAAANFRLVAAELERRFGAGQPSLAIVRTNASWALAGLGDWAEAAREAAAAEAIARSVLGEAHATTARARFFHGWALTGLGRFEEAERFLTASLDARRKIPVSPIEQLQSLQGLARALWWSGRPRQALPLLDEAAELGERHAAAASGRAPVEIDADRADILLALGRPAEALAPALLVLERSAGDPRALLAVEASARLGEIRLALGERDAARERIVEALAGATGESLDARRVRHRALLARARLELAEERQPEARRSLTEARALETACAPGDPARGEAARLWAALGPEPARAPGRSR